MATKPAAPDHSILTWDDLRLFLAIVRGGHFHGAARLMRANPTTISRRLRRMEAVLCTRLLKRIGQELKPTQAGAELLERALAIEILVQDVNDRVRALDVLPCGTVKLCVTEGLASQWLAPRLVAFCEVYPEINLELIPSHGEYDLLKNGSDIAIGWRPPTEPRLVRSRIGALGFGLFASRNYIAKRGEISALSEVGRHMFVQYDANEHQSFGSELMQEARLLNRIRLRTSSVSIYLASIRAGMGIACLPMFYDGHFPDLAKVPLELSEMGELWLVSHEETNSFRRTRLLLDFLRADFRGNRQILFG